MPTLVYFSTKKRPGIERRLRSLPASFDVMRESSNPVSANVFGYSAEPALVVLDAEGSLVSCRQGEAVVQAYLDAFKVVRNG